MNNNIKEILTKPDRAILEIAAGGEILAAYLRFGIYLMVWLVPLYAVFIIGEDVPEMWVAVRWSTFTVLVSLGFLLIAKNNITVPGIAYITTAFDISIVTLVLAGIALNGSPHMAVNGMLVWDFYLIILGLTVIRYDLRVCITAGVLSIAEYLILLFWIRYTWDLSSQQYIYSSFGDFSWHLQAGRIVMMLLATIITCGIVLRSRKLYQVTITDRLTGLGNRIFFDARIADEIARSSRTGSKMTLAFLDLDHFKKLNDRYGHDTGDQALVNFSRLLRDETRNFDITARWGGEEFAVVLLDADSEEAYRIISRISDKMQKIPLLDEPENIFLTVSGGFAEYPSDGTSAEELVQKADERLYRAKNTGRNRLVTG